MEINSLVIFSTSKDKLRHGSSKNDTSIENSVEIGRSKLQKKACFL